MIISADFYHKNTSVMITYIFYSTLLTILFAHSFENKFLLIKIKLINLLLFSAFELNKQRRRYTGLPQKRQRERTANDQQECEIDRIRYRQCFLLHH